MISKTKLKFRARKKRNSILKETIDLARKNEKWIEVAKVLSGPTRNYCSKNLFEIDKNSSAGDTVIIIGKVLSDGALTKRIRICSLGISKKAKEKLNESKSVVVSIFEEIGKNPKAEGVKILR